ncbi:PREDICTED: uncharacterized protein LOC107167592 [Diuraphis noxia]|uniref:uncharacterized protein LOC107167592 n=1 Tax=Diuraphis noxia TaxID=143948 RepID=UPI000763A115|nr:PREDICTED: uncharacterized protein LOC107167592 [Diuraphis noxia]
MTSRNGDSLLLLQQEEDKTNVHLESMSGNDVIRFRNLQQWYKTSICDVKRNFLRNILDACKDPLFLFSLRKIFDKAYTRDIAPYITGDWWSSHTCPAEDNGSLLDLTVSKQTTDDHSNWFGGLSIHVQLAIFVKLMMLGGIGVMTAIRVYLDHLIKSNGNLLSLRNVIGKNTEWKNKLDSFEQKHHAIRRTTEPDSDLAQMLPVWHVIPAGGKLLNDPSCKETNTTTTSTNGNVEHIPLSLSHTLASVTEYKKARNYIDLQIDRRLKIQNSRQSDNTTKLDDCDDFDLHALPFDNNCCTGKYANTILVLNK